MVLLCRAGLVELELEMWVLAPARSLREALYALTAAIVGVSDPDTTVKSVNLRRIRDNFALSRLGSEEFGSKVEISTFPGPPVPSVG